MAKSTKTDYPDFSQISGPRVFAPGTSFGRHCSFHEQCTFGDGCTFKRGCIFHGLSRFGNGCRFGERCILGNHCTFGDGCRFSSNTTAEAGCRFGERCSFEHDGFFRAGCSFGASSLFKHHCLFGKRCSLGQGCEIWSSASFGDNCSLAYGCDVAERASFGNDCELETVWLHRINEFGEGIKLIGSCKIDGQAIAPGKGVIMSILGIGPAPGQMIYGLPLASGGAFVCYYEWHGTLPEFRTWARTMRRRSAPNDADWAASLMAAATVFERGARVIRRAEKG
jgi:UDP-3-O-[3-hydroxymyristoyl] glucosamine N-acyltransferase